MNAGSLSEALAREVVFHAVTGSTNADAHALATAGAASGTLVVTDHQTGGRGRLGRSWQSPPGLNLMFSLVLRPPCEPERAPLLCLATALGVAEAADAFIKWPNDVVDDQDRKLGGILAQLETRGRWLDFVVLGVGLNVNQVEFPPELVEAASVGPGLDRSELLVRCVERIEDRCAQAVHEPAAMLAAWRARSRTLGRRIQVGPIAGIARDVREDGALIVETEEGPKAVLSGDVALIEA